MSTYARCLCAAQAFHPRVSYLLISNQEEPTSHYFKYAACRRKVCPISMFPKPPASSMFCIFCAPMINSHHFKCKSKASAVINHIGH